MSPQNRTKQHDTEHTIMKNKAQLSLPPAIAEYAEKLSKSYWLFLKQHVEAYESGKPDIAATCIVKESQGALQALADVFGLPALKASLEARGETCPIVCQHTDKRLIEEPEPVLQWLYTLQVQGVPGSQKLKAPSCIEAAKRWGCKVNYSAPYVADCVTADGKLAVITWNLSPVE